jgi:hypothetical protein
MMGPAAMSNPDVQGVFIDDVWEEGGPELEGPGSEYAVRDTGMGPADVARMHADWRQTMDAANAAVIAGEGYTWRLFYNNWTCADAPFQRRECAEYMDLVCSPEGGYHRVGPKCDTWSSVLIENPYQKPELGPQFGPTLYNFCSAPLEKNALFYGFSGMTRPGR